VTSEIIAEVSTKSISEISLFESVGKITPDNVKNFLSESKVIEQATEKLEDLGFKILYQGKMFITISGSKDLYDDVFKTSLVRKSVDMFAEVEGVSEEAPFFEGPEGEKVFRGPTGLEDLIEGVSFPEPPIYFESPLPPSVGYFHLDVPADVSLCMKADRVHRFGITGKGIKVAMPDTGFYKHPFYVYRGYRTSVVLAPGATDPDKDNNGHGTGEAANIFATAPDVDFVAIKNGPSSASNFSTAVNQKPDIITCSWGYDLRGKTVLPPYLATLEAAVADAVDSGIVVCFSAGNGHIAFPAMHPDVIAVGGVYCDNNMNIQASDYASSFKSTIYPNRNVPDICGLVGMKPGASYIMLPQQPGSSIEIGRAGGTHPPNDETANDDGWAAFSGTSASSPQVAGVCALLLQTCDKLDPKSIKSILKKTATDVLTGSTNSSADGADSATVGQDLATGNGLVNASIATFIARLRCFILPPRIVKPEPIPIKPKPGPIPKDDLEELEDLLLSELKQ
jgi:subtilisin family serine protease